MPFTPGHPFYRSYTPGAYNAPRPPTRDKYEPVSSVPSGLRWKRAPSGGGGIHTRPPRKPPSERRDLNVRRARRRRPFEEAIVVMYSLGYIYKIVRTLATGAVRYFKLKDIPEISPPEVIDAEPTPAKQVRYRVGTRCWFVDTGSRWYLCVVVERIGGDRATFGEPQRITIKSETGWDADRKCPWPYGDFLEFPAHANNRLWQRLRPLRARGG